MNLATKSPLDLGSGPAEGDGISTATYAQNRKALRLEPRGDLVDIVLAETETISVLLRSEPLVIVDRLRILLLRQKLLQSLLLARRGRDDQRDIAELPRRVDDALVILWLRLARKTLVQGDGLACINRTRNPMRLSG